MTYTQQLYEEKFQESGRQDILPVALEKEEHPCRVRGVGGGMGTKEYFGKSS